MPQVTPHVSLNHLSAFAANSIARSSASTNLHMHVWQQTSRLSLDGTESYIRRGTSGYSNMQCRSIDEPCDIALSSTLCECGLCFQHIHTGPAGRATLSQSQRAFRS
jgi:hypothetical protein